MKINIANQYSDSLGGRFIRDGEFSGEDFRKKFLEPAFTESEEKITVNLDGTFGYPPSFLKEAFGGLVRVMKDRELVKRRLEFVSYEDPLLPNRIENFINQTDEI